MKKPLVMLTCALGALALVLSGCGGTTGSNASDTNGTSNTIEPIDNAKSDPSDTSESDASFVDGVLTTPEMKIVITEHKIIPVGQTGNEYGSKPVIAFWYETTNLSDEDVTPMNWIYAFTAYQDNNPNAENELEIASLPDDRFLDSQTETIKKGGTVENAVAYELDDDTTPVDLVASDDLGMTDIGRVTYNLE